MLYFLITSAIGVLCATVLPWSIMFCVATLISVADFSMHLCHAAGIGIAVAEAAASLAVIQASYVVGGSLLELGQPRIEAKENLQA